MVNGTAWTAFTAIAIVACGRAVTAADDPSVRIRIEDRQGLDARTISRATAIATGIYRRARIALILDDDTAPIRLVIATTSAAEAEGFHPAASSLGVAFAGNDGPRGTVAFALYDR